MITSDIDNSIRSPFVGLIFPREVIGMVYAFTEIDNCELTDVPVHIENPWAHKQSDCIILSHTDVRHNVL